MKLIVDVFEENKGRKEIFIAKTHSYSHEIRDIIAKINFPKEGVFDIEYISDKLEICIVKCDNAKVYEEIRRKFKTLFQVF